MYKVVLIVILAGLCCAEPPIDTYLSAAGGSSSPLSAQYGVPPSSRFSGSNPGYPDASNYDHSVSPYHLAGGASDSSSHFNLARQLNENPLSSHGLPATHLGGGIQGAQGHYAGRSLQQSAASGSYAAFNQVSGSQSSGYNYHIPSTQLRSEPASHYVPPTSEDQYSSIHPSARGLVGQSGTVQPFPYTPSAQYGAPTGRSAVHTPPFAPSSAHDATFPFGSSPTTQYGTPSAFNKKQAFGFGTPQGFTTARSATPSTQYGLPTSPQFAAHSPFSSTPSPQYGGPTTIAPTLSTQSPFRSGPPSHYGVPSSVKSSLPPHYGAPSTFRGAKTSPFGSIPSTQYGTPSTHYDTSSAFRSSPSSQYGVPTPSNFAQSSHNDASSTYRPSTQYAASSSLGSSSSATSLSAQYGAPSSRSYSPSSLYGAPSSSNDFGSSTYSPQSLGHSDLSAGGHSEHPSTSAIGQGHEYARASSLAGGSGHSDQSKYEFNYDVKEGGLGVEFGQSESREGKDTKGFYHVVLPDGRRQKVEYTAGESGYKPNITYEDTGIVARIGGGRTQHNGLPNIPGLGTAGHGAYRGHPGQQGLGGGSIYQGQSDYENHVAPSRYLSAQSGPY